MPYRILTLFVSFVLLISSSIHAQDNTHLVVTWLENNNVMVWHTGDAAPTPHSAPEDIASNTRQLLISSDGQYVALNAAFPGSFWLATPTDNAMIEAVPNESLPAQNANSIRIGNLQRGAKGTFYFNTYDQPSHYTFQHDDLWLVDPAGRTYNQLLPSPQAGSFNLSPDNQHIAIVQSGGYNKTDGKLSLVDSGGQNRLEITSFTAVSTASDYDFYPQPFWQTDSSGFNIAIPGKDLVYNDNTALTALWHISTTGTKTQMGAIQATFFGLPQWSGDGTHILYLHRIGDATSNQFELMIASGDGSSPTMYASGTAGAIGVPQWLPNSDQFIYAQGEPGDYWLGQAGQPPQALPGKIFSPRFVDATSYVFINGDGELRYAHLGDPDSTLIAKVNNTSALFDTYLVTLASS